MSPVSAGHPHCQGHRHSCQDTWSLPLRGSSPRTVFLTPTLQTAPSPLPTVVLTPTLQTTPSPLPIMASSPALDNVRAAARPPPTLQAAPSPLPTVVLTPPLQSAPSPLSTVASSPALDNSRGHLTRCPTVRGHLPVAHSKLCVFLCVCTWVRVCRLVHGCTCDVHVHTHFSIHTSHAHKWQFCSYTDLPRDPQVEPLGRRMVANNHREICSLERVMSEQ